MILSKDGWTDLYVCNSDGTGLKRLTKSPQDESSPCWSPDGQWICYASKDRERRALSKISPEGGEPQRIPTAGVLSPTEPDWSPDGKWIAFTVAGRGFQYLRGSGHGRHRHGAGGGRRPVVVAELAHPDVWAPAGGRPLRALPA